MNPIPYIHRQDEHIGVSIVNLAILKEQILKKKSLMWHWANPDPNQLIIVADPDPLDRGTDPDPDRYIIKQYSKKNLDSYCSVTSFLLFIFEK
jgi:hypothetical protein